MSIRYDETTKARAVRLVREHRDDYESEWAAMKAISGRLGMNPETLRKWVRQAEIDAGEALGVSSEERRELRELRRKCRELESTIEILKAAFLCWEGWRDVDQVRREHQGQGGTAGPRTPRRL